MEALVGIAIGLSIGGFITTLVFAWDLHERAQYIEDRLDRYFDMIVRSPPSTHTSDGSPNQRSSAGESK